MSGTDGVVWENFINHDLLTEDEIKKAYEELFLCFIEAVRGESIIIESMGVVFDEDHLQKWMDEGMGQGNNES